jgi:hypothetical protein
MTALSTLAYLIDKGQLKKQVLSLLFLFAISFAQAAPLDALVTASPEGLGHPGYLEVGSDHMNAQLDFFGIRDTNALAAGTQAGDYHGSHVAGGWRVTDKFWLSGMFWQRNLSGLSNTYRFDTWQVSGSYGLRQADGKIPGLALRLSAWRNTASEVVATNICAAPVVGSPKQCQVNAFLDSVKIADPSDRNMQVDLIGSWQPASNTEINVLLGIGNSQLSYSGLSGLATIDGKSYQLSPDGGDILFTAADGSQRIARGVYNSNEVAWRGNFIQLGANAAWNHGPWTLRGGYLFYAIQREAIDDLLKSRGWSVVNQNRTLMLETDYRFTPRISIFARGQISSSLIFNDMPVIYNAFSSDLVGGRYSIYSLGLRADF